jgi:hypothetical protein
LSTTPARFFVGKSNRFDTTHQVGQCRVEEQVLQVVTVGSTNELNATFCNRAGSSSFELSTNLVNDDHFRIMVFDRLDHDFMLKGGQGNLHAARSAYCRMGNIAITADFVRSINDDHAFIISQNTGSFSQNGCFSNTRTTQDQQVLSAFDEILEDIRSTVDCSAHATGKTNNVTSTIPYTGDSMKGTLDTGSIVGIEIANAVYNVIDIHPGYFYR